MRIAYSATITALLMAVAASAQDSPTRVRGTVESVHGSMLIVKSRDGGSLEIKLAENVAVVAMVKASLADIRPGSFVGATAMPQDDGHWKAVEVRILPERMRGVGEGDRPNDYRPRSTMTNGTVGNVAIGSGGATVTKEEGTTLTLAYKEGEKRSTSCRRRSSIRMLPEIKTNSNRGLL